MGLGTGLIGDDPSPDVGSASYKKMKLCPVHDDRAGGDRTLERREIRIDMEVSNISRVTGLDPDELINFLFSRLS